jgi:hypothetical protein
MRSNTLIVMLNLTVALQAQSPAQLPQASAAKPPTVRLIDAVVASVDNSAITLSEVQTEYRIQYFLENERIPSNPPDPSTIERVRDQLIDQWLLAEEIAPAASDFASLENTARKRLAKIQADVGSKPAFEVALQELGLSESQLLARLVEQERTLQAIDQRLRPQVSVSQPEVEAYYRNKFVPEYLKQNFGSAPPLTEVEGPIREILVQQRVNQLLEAWLTELRSERQVRILGGAGVLGGSRRPGR